MQTLVKELSYMTRVQVFVLVALRGFFICLLLALGVWLPTLYFSVGPFLCLGHLKSGKLGWVQASSQSTDGKPCYSLNYSKAFHLDRSSLDFNFFLWRYLCEF